MKKHPFIIVTFILTGAILGSCQRELQTVDAVNLPDSVRMNNADTPEEYLQLGVINVRITPEFAKEVEAKTGEYGKVNVHSVKSMGYAIKDLGILTMERLFPYAGKFEARTRAEGLHLWYTIRFDETKSITKAAGDLSLIPGIDIIDPVPEIRPAGGTEVKEYITPTSVMASSSAVFNDPMLASQWHYYNNGSGKDAQSGCDINVMPVWKKHTVGSPDVIVCVVDGGIDYNHEDLAANMWHDPDDYSIVGYNFCTDDYNITSYDHATHVAGTIAAVNNNGKGVCGIAGGDYEAGQPGVRLMSCQIFSKRDGSGSGEAAIKWGADHGAVISQNSWGYTSPCDAPDALIAAVDYFVKYAGFDENGCQTGPMAGGLVVFSAGNEDSSSPYGSNYNKMLTVTSVGPDYIKAHYSNYGDWCDISAPGGDVNKGQEVVSTLPGNKYGKMEGTSMACPHVSGVAALIVSAQGGEGFTASELRSTLIGNTTDISSFNPEYELGSGLVNAYKAMYGTGGKAPERITSFKLEKPSSNIVTFSATVPSDEDDSKPSSIIVYFSEEPITDTYGLRFSSFYVGDTEAGQTLSGKITGLNFRTKYYFVAVASDLAGNESALSDVRTATTGDNHAPVIQASGPTEFTIETFGSTVLSFDVNDPDGHYALIDLKKGSSAEILDTLDETKPKITIKALMAVPGTYTSTLSATDHYGLSSKMDFTYTIMENNDPISVAEIGNRIFNSKSESLTLNEKDYFTDEDDEPLTYQIDNSDESVVDISYSDGVFYFKALDYGYSDIGIIGRDARKSKVTQKFKLLVRDGNDPMDVYPNPVTEYLYVRTSEDVTATLRLVNALGASVYEERQLDITPFAPAEIDVTGLAAGTYTIVLDANGKRLSKTVVKL